MTQDRPFLGIMLMLGFCMLIPASDAIAKYLGAVLPIALIVVARVVIQAALLAPLTLATGGRLIPAREHLWPVILRTLLYVGALGMMYLALRYLPLADAIAIAFVMPFLMLLLGHWFLGEEVGSRRLGACVVGFVGTLLVVQPSFAAVGWPALLPLGVAVLFSFFMLVTRQIAKAVDPVALQATSGALAAVILLPLLLVGHAFGWADIRFVAVSAPEALLLAAMGIVGTIAHLLMTWSLRFAPSATLAPMQYLEIPFATVAGYIAFRDLPNGLAALGIAVTISAGLYIIARERSVPQKQVPAPPAAP